MLFCYYRVRNIVNKRENDVICHSVRRSRVPTSFVILQLSTLNVNNALTKIHPTKENHHLKSISMDVFV